MRSYNKLKEELDGLFGARIEKQALPKWSEWRWDHYQGKQAVPPPPPGPGTRRPKHDELEDLLKDLEEIAKAEAEVPASEDDLYKIGYMDGKMNESEDERYKANESYQMGYRDGKGDEE